MNELISHAQPSVLASIDIAVPAIVADQGERAATRFVEFFTANIRNRNTRRAYGNAVTDFFAWCERFRLELTSIQPVHVAAYVEQLGQEKAPPTVKQHLAAIRMLFDWMVIGQVVPSNPASSVRGPKHVVDTGKTAVLSRDEVRALLDNIDLSTPVGLRDRALITLLLCTFARVGAALQMTVADVYRQERGLWVRLKEKGGKQHQMPCNHMLEEHLLDYLEACGFRDEPKHVLFSTWDRKEKCLSDRALYQSDVHAMIRRRLRAAEIDVPAGCHSFRATGITVYLDNGGTLERAQKMAAHASPRTTKLYDRTADVVTRQEVERILI